MSSIEANTLNSRSGTINVNSNLNLLSGKTLTVTGTGTTTLNGLLLANLGLTVTGGNTSVTTFSSSGLLSANLGITVTGTSTLALTNISGVTSITNNTASSSTSSGALVVTGGVGIGGDLFGTTFNSSGLATLNSLTVTGATIHNGTVTISGTNTFTMNTGLFTTAGLVTITNATSSSSTSSGALVVTGGLGIGGNLFVGGTGNFSGVTNITNTAAATNNTTAALVVSGGIGVAKDCYIGNIGIVSPILTMYGRMAINSGTTINNQNGIFLFSGGTVATLSSALGTNLSFAAFNHFAGTTINATNISTSITNIATVRIISAPIAGTNIINAPNFYSLYIDAGTTLFADTIASSSTSTGTVIVNGGTGIGGNLFIGGTGNFAGVTNITNSTGIPSAISSNTPSGSINIAGALALTGSANYSNVIMFTSNNNAEPNGINTIRSVGSKLILWSNLSTTATDYAIGIGSASMWYQVDVAAVHNWYCGGTKVANLNTTSFTINNTTAAPSTNSTPSGALNVAGALALTGSAGQSMIMINGGSYGAPSAASRSNGSRLILNPSTLGGSSFDYAIGIHNSPVQMWFSTNTLSDHYIFYHNSSNSLDITNASTTFGSNNIVSITNTTNSTSTSTGALIVSGGAAVVKDFWLGGKFTPIHSVTQTTSPVANTGSTGFTTNGITGSLLVNVTSLAANSVYTYTMNNALITTSSIILVSSVGDPLVAFTQSPGSGSVVIVVRNIGTSAIGSGNISINFFIIS